MKHCPECQSRFTDEGLKFCRFDGVKLVTDANWDEAPTLLFNAKRKETDTAETSVTGPLFHS